MTQIAKFSGSASLEKTVTVGGAATTIALKVRVLIPSSLLTLIAGNTNGPALLQWYNQTASLLAEGIFISEAGGTPPWQWWSQQTSSGRDGTVVADTYVDLEADWTFISGTTWHVVWKAAGSTLFGVTTVSQTHDFSAHPDLKIVIGHLVTSAGDIGIQSASVEVNGSPIFSDDFTTASNFSAWDATNGSVSLVGDASMLPGFDPGDSGVGAGGVRISVAFDDPTLEPTPAWTDLTALQPTLVAGYEITRGRQYELDLTQDAQATINIVDRSGNTDPTNSFGPYYGLLEPDLQVKIDLWNPITEDYHTRFRGFVEDFDWDLDPSQQYFRLQVSCYDIMALLTAIEMQPGQFGDTPQEAGTVFFASSTSSTFEDRIDQVLGNAGLPVEFYVRFSGNIHLLDQTMSPGQNPLEVIQEIVDAEFPGVANAYTDRLGRLAMHGRLAEFDAHGTWVSIAGTDADRDAVWEYRQWEVGDEAAFNSFPLVTVQMRPPFTFNRGRSKIINQAICYPADILQADIAGQVYSDLVSIGLRGFKSWSKENLIIADGILTGNSGKDECLAYATFRVKNDAAPQNRVTQLNVMSIRPEDPRAENIWEMLCHSDISHKVFLNITHPGGGGFHEAEFFIQGITETCAPATGDFAMVTQSYDVSPKVVADLEGLDGN
jgi:hypothetical protein